MAIDKVIDSAVLDSNLTAVANAIRAKGGTSDPLEFPDGFVSAVEAIQAGGGGEADDALKGLIERTATEITLPTGLTKIGNHAFRECANLSLESLPSGLKSIGEYAFYGCSKLALASLPDSLEELGSNAFNACKAITVSRIPPLVKTIPNGLFGNTKSITEMTFPAGVTSVGLNLFVGNSYLTEITFEGTPTSIVSNAFQSCSGLATINVPWSEGEVANAPWGATNATINYNYTGEA